MPRKLRPYGIVKTTTEKSAQRDANTARALAVVSFGHRPPARCHKPGVEQDMKNWKGEKFRAQSIQKFFCSCPPTIPVCPPLVGGTCLFLPPPPLGHARCCHNESESYRHTIICRHCVDQQTDSLVFTEFQSDLRE